jgi:CMP-N,N'-diacetyllegionaminic acid synthase|tara:strand:- start:2016 stop:2354 length:339 start_codon:yes stop_codon:yes gene_type:complete
MIFCFDLDNVICKSDSLDYSISKPYVDVIHKINSLYDKGNKILIFTARYMGRNNGNKDLAIQQGYKSTEIQLRQWDLKYHELIFGKPIYDVFVDDKNFDFKKDWLLDFKKRY